MTVFTITYNEEYMLPHFIEHYRANFPDCRIVVYDNESTDSTVDIARENNCEVRTYRTNNQLSDRKYLDIKNKCWKGVNGWVIVADCDEFCDITPEELEEEERAGVSIVRFEGYNMVNMEDNMDFHGIRHGIRAESYDKYYLFDTRKVYKIGYGFGCHHASPRGMVKVGGKPFRCRHYKYVNPDHMIARHRVFAARLSDENRQRGFGGHYLYPPEQIREEFENARQQAIKIM